MKEKILSGLVFLLFLILVGSEKISFSSFRGLFSIQETHADAPVPEPGGDCCGCECD